MTTDTFPRTLSGRLIEWAKIIGALSVIASAGGGLYVWTFGPAKQFFESIDTLIADVQALKMDVDRANGEDRVIRQPSGLSYIKEPVHVGENVTMFLVVSRTTLGSECRLREWVPIFQDERYIPTPGDRARAGPIAQQIGTDMQTLRIEMIPPTNLRPGRITVYLALTYDCPTSNGATVIPDQTAILAYELIQ